MRPIKVWGIGLSKTGTSSLTEALQILGLKSRHYPTTLSHFLDYDACTDVPVIPLYKSLDAVYPGSKFILTNRNFDSWMRSTSNHFSSPEDPKSFVGQMRLIVYGTLVFDHQLFFDRYHSHLSDVRTYFKNRRNDLLELDICAGEGWEKLCPFLGLSIPPVDFPFLNRSKGL